MSPTNKHLISSNKLQDVKNGFSKMEVNVGLKLWEKNLKREQISLKFLIKTLK